MSLRFSIRILDHLTHRDYSPVKRDEMFKQLRISTDDRDEFNASIDELVDAGRLELGKDDRYRLPDFGDEVEGVYKSNPRGFGFVEPAHPVRHGSLFIPPGAQGSALSGDRVIAKVRRRSRGEDAARGGPQGEIIEVLERGRDEFVGRLVKRGRDWVVEPDGRSLRAPILVRDPHVKNAKVNDKVVFEITLFPEENALGEGVIVRVLGEAGRPDVETQAVIAAHDLRQEFPPEAVDEAREAAKAFERESREPWSDREDLTESFIFTIDPPDAKDFDDAISIEERGGKWTLGVHIADVSHFVAPGSALDEEAKARGNSVYLPRLVLPMLPEALSNGVCSLQEGVVRFTKSAFIEFDSRGRVEGQRLASTVIRSVKRLTYLEAQALIDGDLDAARQNARTEPNYSEELIETLRRADRLAHILEARRKSDGMLTLDLPAVELVFDENGHVIDAVPEDNAYTHKLIEMFMVEANEALARTFADLNLPLIRRIHPEPSFADIETLRLHARLAQWQLPDEPTRQDIQALLNATKATPAARAIHYAVLRTFTRATYSPALIGHFALASEHYTHFTSPIRRYPDLTVHRAMQAYLDETGNGARRPGGRQRRHLAERIAQDERVLDETELLDLGRHCSDTERAAADAEQELRTFLVMQLLHEKHLGDEFEAIVTGVTPNAVFVSLQRFLVDGMVKVAELSSGAGSSHRPEKKKRSSSEDEDQPTTGHSAGRTERWTLHDSTARLHAQRSGFSIGVGDLVTVQIAAVDLPSRTLTVRVVKFAESKSLPPVPDDGASGGRRGGAGKGGRKFGKKAGGAKGSALGGRSKKAKGGKVGKKSRRGR